MLTKAALKDIIVENFNDIRMTSIVLFVNALIERKAHGGGVNQYRLKNKLTGTYITSVEQFLTAIDANSLKMDYYRYSDKMTGDRVHPISVVLDNIEVELQKFADEDAYYFAQYGESTRLMMLINYVSDGDTVLPLKVFEIKLT